MARRPQRTKPIGGRTIGEIGVQQLESFPPNCGAAGITAKDGRRSGITRRRSTNAPVSAVFLRRSSPRRLPDPQPPTAVALVNECWRWGDLGPLAWAAMTIGAARGDVRLAVENLLCIHEVRGENDCIATGCRWILVVRRAMTWEQWQELLASRTHPPRLMTLEEMANLAGFIASDKASGMTGTLVDLTMGAPGRLTTLPRRGVVLTR